MAIKPIRVLYSSKNFTTGLADVKAQVYLNATQEAVSTNALLLSELDATNAPGIYYLVLTAAQLSGYGAVVGDDIKVVINSVSHSAESAIHYTVTAISTDDIDAKLGTPAGATVSVDIAAVKSDTSAIKADLETGSASLATILAAINQIKSNAGFAVPVPATLVKPASGSNTYRIPTTIYNQSNALIDPDSSAISVGLVNQAGADRSSYLTGYVAGASGANGSAPMVRDSLGQYHIDLAIPSTAAQEELLFKFSYAVGGAATVRSTVSEIITDVNADGFALQTTLLAAQTTINAINSLVTDPTNGLANIEAQIANGTYGLSALQQLSSAIQSLLNNGTYGLAALQSGVSGVQSSLNNATYGLSALQVNQSSIQGAGFVTGSDSLHAISQYLQANVYSGGRAV